MLKERTPIGIWSDEMPPINLYNYPMQHKPEYKHKEVAKTLAPFKPGEWRMVPEGISIQEFAKHIGMETPNAVSQEHDKHQTFPVDARSGTKYDGGKPRMDLLDADWLEGVAKVLTFGASKYDANNWRKGINFSRLIGAAYRHLGAINRGEDTDPESGLPHVFHLSCCVMFLSSMMKNKPELDDRYKA